MAEQSFALRSSAISGGTYDDETEELTLDFASGGSYTFEGVPAEIVAGLLAAPSAGKFYHAIIKPQFGG
jgi:hypothetical protein